ncbi:MAG: cytochrome P450 [Actinomycetota bacterium]
MTTPEVNFFDPETSECPYDAYAQLRDEAPVWRDPNTGMYVITRYEDLKALLMDTETYSSERKSVRRSGREAHLRSLYEHDGWVPAPTLAGRDDPNHKQMRALFDHAFRPSRIKQLDPIVERIAHELIDDFIDDGRCDWVRQFAVPLPLLMIGQQMGTDPADIWRIKAWTDAWVQRLGMMQTDEEAEWSVRMEIEAQHYFQPLFERLREQPEDTLFSDLVNTVIPEWGRTLTDEELHAEMMADTFVGGSETSTNALSAGAKLLIENPDVWERICADPDTTLPVFVEEVVRLEGPVQGLFRITTREVELHGVTIPAGSMINVRYAAANRDERQFERADEIDLDRRAPRSHLAYGAGVHYCLGAPLARRELLIGFRALVDRIAELRFADGNNFRHQPNFCLRALQELHVEFTPRVREGR